MPEWVIKKGMASVEVKDYLATLKDEDYIRISIEVESSHERLRRSFHGLLDDWFECGEWSCNGAEIYTMKRFKEYYKYHGCDYIPIGYTFRGEEYKPDKKKKETLDDALMKLLNDFPEAKGSKDLKPLVKSWKYMNKKQKSKALNLLLTEIKLSMTSNQKVLKRVAEITGDIEMLNDIQYYKHAGG